MWPSEELWIQKSREPLDKVRAADPPRPGLHPIHAKKEGKAQCCSQLQLVSAVNRYKLSDDRPDTGWRGLLSLLLWRLFLVANLNTSGIN